MTKTTNNADHEVINSKESDVQDQVFYKARSNFKIPKLIFKVENNLIIFEIYRNRRCIAKADATTLIITRNELFKNHPDGKKSKYDLNNLDS